MNINAFTIGDILGAADKCADVELGRKVIRSIGFGLSMAWGWACTALFAWWLGLLLALLGGAAIGYCIAKVSDENCAAFGAKLGSTAARISNLFTRKG